jgi:ATP-dependent Clp protease ATP-binding subunit ClpB
LNRIDEIVIFNRLQKEQMKQIVDLQLHRVMTNLKENKDITLEVSDDIKALLAEEGYDPAFGARPLKRLIENKILNPLAVEIIEGKVKEGSKVTVKLSGKKIVFSVR